jgi:Porin PorA
MRPSKLKVLTLALGAVLLLAGILWRPVAEPALVKFPSDLNVTTHYQGTATLSVDSRTGAPLARPARLPLTVDRHLQAVAGGGARTVVIRETITVGIAGRTQVQANQYVMDRRSMRNLKSPSSWAFAPAAMVDRSGSYYVNLPMGTKRTRSYRVWSNQAGAAYPLAVPGGGRTTTVGGLATIRLAGAQPATPVGQAEAAALRAQGLPASLTASQFAARLRAAGIDLEAVTGALAAVLSPAELQRVGQAMAAPVPLRYQWATSGQADVEPRTGAIVRLSSVAERLTVRPDTGGMAAIAPALAAHASSPSVARIAALLQAAGKAPAQPVYQLAYDETPASVASTAAIVRQRLSQMRFAQVYIPWSLIVVGLVLLVLAGAAAARGPQPALPSGRPDRTGGEARRVRA